MKPKRPPRFKASIVAALVGLAATESLVDAQPITYRTVTSTVRNAIWACSPPGRTDLMFVASKEGVVSALDLQTGALLAVPPLVLPDVIRFGEAGLLGMACHPDFESNGYLYLYYTREVWPFHPDSWLQLTLVRYTCPGPARDAPGPASRAIIASLLAEWPSNLHVGGWIGFGPDNLLYWAIGDSQSPLSAQNTAAVNGKVLRIDVDRDEFPADPIRNYAIPPTNPFAGGPDLGEVFLWGLRNPFRCGFDSERRILYVGDVGSSYREELSAVHIDEPGSNLGWPCYEGTMSPWWADVCDGMGPVRFPIIEYNDDVPPLLRQGQSIITGGAYTGCAVPDLRHRVLLTDYFWNNEFYSFSHENQTVSNLTRHMLPGLGGRITGFARDGKGEIYILSSSGIHKLIPATAQSADLNADGSVNTPDLIFLLSRFSHPAPAGSPNAVADFNTDAVINTPDLTYFLNRFGTTCP
ncbi:MAG: PQQ-dependent sugar dehydrogenase [Phycisphaerales bacterium]